MIKKRFSPSTIIAINFLLVIIVGGLLLRLPISIQKGANLTLINAMYISTSAVCVTGLSPLDIGTTLTLFGRIVLALLIQIGGLGITVISTLFIIAIGKKVDIRNRNIIRETLNFESGKGVVHFVKDVFTTTLIFEFIGSLICFMVFVRDFNITRAIGISIFHSISAFNNAGFDILGLGNNLVKYQNNIVLNITTSLLIIIGGLGFLVIREVFQKRFKWKKYSMHTKVVLYMSLFLTLLGTIVIKYSENITLLGAFFTSVSSRTAGFFTFSLKNFKISTNLMIIILMFIGASPGSTGGGIKTTTFFVLILGLKENITNKKVQIFHYSLPKNAYKKATAVFILSISVTLFGVILILNFENNLTLLEALFETISAFATVGLSLDVTSILSNYSKVLCMIMMFVGRLGPLTITSLGTHSAIGENVYYPEGNISIG